MVGLEKSECLKPAWPSWSGSQRQAESVLCWKREFRVNRLGFSLSTPARMPLGAASPIFMPRNTYPHQQQLGGFRNDSHRIGYSITGGRLSQSPNASALAFRVNETNRGVESWNHERSHTTQVALFLQSNHPLDWGIDHEDNFTAAFGLWDTSGCKQRPWVVNEERSEKWVVVMKDLASFDFSVLDCAAGWFPPCQHILDTLVLVYPYSIISCYA